jgi:hypothetical protein
MLFIVCKCTRGAIDGRDGRRGWCPSRLWLISVIHIDPSCAERDQRVLLILQQSAVILLLFVIKTSARGAADLYFSMPDRHHAVSGVLYK